MAALHPVLRVHGHDADAQPASRRIPRARQRHVQLPVAEHRARQIQPDPAERLALRLADRHRVRDLDRKLQAPQRERKARFREERESGSV